MDEPDFSDPEQGIPALPGKNDLSTDYINHFSEIVMMLELLPGTPELLEDVLAWTPASYVEHFQRSHFSTRDVVLARYASLPEEQRNLLERLSMDATRLVVTTQLLLREGKEGEELSALCDVSCTALRVLIRRLSALIADGSVPASTLSPEAQQAWIDAIFDPASRKTS